MEDRIDGPFLVHLIHIQVLIQSMEVGIVVCTNH